MCLGVKRSRYYLTTTHQATISASNITRPQIWTDLVSKMRRKAGDNFASKSGKLLCVDGFPSSRARIWHQPHVNSTATSNIEYRYKFITQPSLSTASPAVHLPFFFRCGKVTVKSRARSHVSKEPHTVQIDQHSNHLIIKHQLTPPPHSAAQSSEHAMW